MALINFTLLSCVLSFDANCVMYAMWHGGWSEDEFHLAGGRGLSELID